MTLKRLYNLPQNRLIALLALGAQKKSYTSSLSNGFALTPMVHDIEHGWLSVTTASGKGISDPKDGPLLDRCFYAAMTASPNTKSIIDLLRTEPDELNRKDAIYGMTALMWAAALGHLKLVQILLAQPKIDRSATDKFGDTALHYAARNGHTNVVELLLTYPEALGTVPNSAGATPYDLAKMRDHKTVGRLLGHDRMIQTRIMRYFTTLAKNNAHAPRDWPFLPAEIALRILATRAQPIGSDRHAIHKIIELCQKNS